MLNLTRLAALARFPETPLTLAEVVELAALATAAAGELQQWRTRFEHDDPEGFSTHRDEDRANGVIFYTRHFGNEAWHTHRYPALRRLSPIVAKP